jgi:hypothetical protein
MRVLGNKLNEFQHLSDETISRLIAGEIGAFGGFRAKFHLDKCWHCRSRREALERAAMQVAEYRNRIVEGAPVDRQRRERLLSDLRRRAAQGAPPPMWIRFISNLHVWIGKRMSPIVTSAAIVIVATVLLIVVWQRALSPVSAAQLLQRAIASDASVSQEKQSVIYQKVLVTTPRLKAEHEVYRDPRGIRHRTRQTKAEPVRDVLSAVGVDWNAPLSAASYSGWHDQQSSVTDEVRKGDGNLITLVSKVRNGWIQEETLTVRGSDFHPIARTIATRTYGTVEIAELSYAELPWSGVNDALFEPLGTSSREATVLPPALPTSADLDVAELSVRLALNQLHADEGEQISVTQTQHAVDVKGVVATSERKTEILKSLLPIQHVRVDVLSIAELQSLPLDKSVTKSVQMQSVDVLPSPLAKYMEQQGQQKTALAEASHGLLDASLKVRQNVNELLALQSRFAAKDLLDPEKSMMSRLLQSYSERMIEGLDQEAATLNSLGFVDHGFPLPDAAGIDLGKEVDRNDARCRELIAGSGEAVRPAAELAPEIYGSIARIRLAVAAQTNAIR